MDDKMGGKNKKALEQGEAKESGVLSENEKLYGLNSQCVSTNLKRLGQKSRCDRMQRFSYVRNNKELQ